MVNFSVAKSALALVVLVACLGLMGDAEAVEFLWQETSVDDDFEGAKSVFAIDLDGDSVQDDDEPSVSSDEKGFFVVERLDAKEGFSPQIISTGGTPKASKQIAQVKKGEATGAIANG